MYPTLVDLCQLPKYSNQNTNQQQLDGYSLRPVLENPALQSRSGPDFTLTYVASKTGSVETTGAMSAPQDHHATIRNQQYRYVLCANGEEELYDHRHDPHEWHNLADSTAFTDLKNAMKSKLIDFTQQK